jgi:hypothetical protein
MGCDIHSFAEVRSKVTGKWEKVGDVFSLDEYDKKWHRKDKSEHPFDWRSYSMFAFLADVRNYDDCEPLSEPKGLPGDSEYLNSPSPYGDQLNYAVEGILPGQKQMTIKDDIEDNHYHSHSWLSLRELVEFDYDKVFWNRRITKQEGPGYYNGAALASEGKGEMISYRKNLGEWFFLHLEELKSLGDLDDVRVVFWFDN